MHDAHTERLPASAGRRGDLAMRLVLAGLSQLRCGQLRVRAANGSARDYRGAGEGPTADLRIHDPARLVRRLTRGDLGFAEAYMDGAWDTSDLATLLELGALNEDALGRLLRMSGVVRALLGLRHRLRGNTRRGSRRNIAYHYDLGNDFYRLWLDPSMTYSSALFEPGAETLEAAQQAKYRRLVGLLAPVPDDPVLEIGCGWGGFAIEAARSTGCRVTGVTLSREQLAWARERVRREGLEDRVELRLQDYREVEGEFDRVASIEMFEAVGESFWPVFFRTVATRLKPGGRAAMQVITIDDEHFEGYRSTPDFIQRYIFPGGMLPSPSRFAGEVAAAGLEQAETAFFGAHYARTLACWEETVLRERPRITELGFDERFLRMWHYYLAYCQAGFRTGRVDLMQTVLRRPT